MMMIGIGIPITQSNNERMGHSLECEGQMRRCANGSLNRAPRGLVRLQIVLGVVDLAVSRRRAAFRVQHH